MTLHTERHGSGRPILMVHGIGGSVRSFDPIVPRLSELREVILFDLPGHGRSPALSGPQTVAAFADRIEAYIDSEGLEGVDLVGSSFGARLVLELSRRGVGRHCVSLDPGGFWQGWETRYFGTTLAASIRLVRWLQPVMPFIARHAATRSLLLAQLSARPWALSPDLVLTEMRSFASTKVFDAVARELATGPLQMGAANTPGRLAIGWGRQDRLLLPRQAYRAQAAFPSAKLHWFDGCGHFPQWDQPAQTVQLIEATTAGN